MASPNAHCDMELWSLCSQNREVWHGIFIRRTQTHLEPRARPDWALEATGPSCIQTREGKEEGDQRRAERVQKMKTANMQRRCIHEGRIQEIAICRNRGENRSDGAYI